MRVYRQPVARDICPGLVLFLLFGYLSGEFKALFGGYYRDYFIDDRGGYRALNYAEVFVRAAGQDRDRYPRKYQLYSGMRQQRKSKILLHVFVEAGRLCAEPCAEIFPGGSCGNIDKGEQSGAAIGMSAFVTEPPVLNSFTIDRAGAGAVASAIPPKINAR